MSSELFEERSLMNARPYSLTYVRRTELFDFHQPKNLGKTTAYTYLFKWIQKYFQQSGTNMIHPLYLQHEGQSLSLKRILRDLMASLIAGHSRTIVGYEQFRDGNIRLLIFDPSTSTNEIENFKRNPNSKAHIFRRNLASFQKPVYQVLVVRGLLDATEREVRVGSFDRSVCSSSMSFP